MSSRIIGIEYFGCMTKEFLRNEEQIKQELRAALEKAGATVFDVYAKTLGPGVTSVAIIGDTRGEFRGRSHGAFHTYPEYAYARLVFDCYPHMIPENAIEHFYGILQPSKRPSVEELRLKFEEL